MFLSNGSKNVITLPRAKFKRKKYSIGNMLDHLGWGIFENF